MEVRPELTIAIPTYNRKECLQQSLVNVIEHSRGKDIEILISDNASTDGTEEFVKFIQKENPSIKYYKNAQNLGFDGNFLNCFEKAQGKYVMLLSDDDVLLDGAIDSILEALKCAPICMHLNSSELISQVPLEYEKIRYEEEGILYFDDRNDFIKKIGIMCTFVSSLVFKTDLVRAVPNKEKYFKSNILQSHVLFEIMKNEGIYLVNTQNCLAAKGNHTVKYDIFRTWIKNYSDLMLDTAISCGFKKEVMEEVLEQELDSTVYNFVIHFRRTCEHEKWWDRECVWKYLDRYPKLKIKYKIAISCPVKLLPFLILANKVKNKIKEKEHRCKKIKR